MQEISESFGSINENSQPVDEFSSNGILTEENLDFPPMISMQGKHIGSRRYLWAGYVYVRDGYSQTFRCSNREQYQCPGRAIIKNGDVRETKKHSHPREPHILPLEQAKEKMLLRAQLNRSLSLRTIYLEACETEPLVSSHLDLTMMVNKMKKVRRNRHLRSSNLNTKRTRRCQPLNKEFQPEKQDHFVRNDEDTLEKTTDNSDSDQEDTHEVLEQFREDADRVKAAKILKKRKIDDHSSFYDKDTKPKISVHICDPNTGLTASGLHVSLHRLKDDVWEFINRTKTDENGKCGVSLNGQDLAIGLYKLNLDTRSYYSLRNQKCLYPYIEIIFDVENTDELYHFPVQLSPSSYNVCRLSKT